MRKIMTGAAFVLAGGLLSSGAAFASPVSNMGNALERPSAVEKTQGWRYRRDCVWVNGGWNYRDHGRFVVCRPPSPGPGWVWYSEGPRSGWYNTRRRAWYNNKW